MPYFWSAVGWYKSVHSRQWWTTKSFTLPTSLHLRCCLYNFLTYAALQQDGNGISRSTVLMRPDWLPRQMRLCSWIAFVRLLAEVPQLESTLNIWAGGMPGIQSDGVENSIQCPPSPAHGNNFDFFILNPICWRFSLNHPWWACTDVWLVQVEQAWPGMAFSCISCKTCHELKLANPVDIRMLLQMLNVEVMI